MMKDNRLKAFIWINVIALLYALISFYLGQPWIHELTKVTGSNGLSVLIVLFIALIPGYLNILLLASLYFYKYRPARIKPSEFPPIKYILVMCVFFSVMK